MFLAYLGHTEHVVVLWADVSIATERGDCDGLVVQDWQVVAVAAIWAQIVRNHFRYCC